MYRYSQTLPASYLLYSPHLCFYLQVVEPPASIWPVSTAWYRCNNSNSAAPPRPPTTGEDPRPPHSSNSSMAAWPGPLSARPRRLWIRPWSSNRTMAAGRDEVKRQDNPRPSSTDSGVPGQGKQQQLLNSGHVVLLGVSSSCWESSSSCLIPAMLCC